MKTAVEWLVEQLKDDRFLSAFEEEIKQAKELEKQQIIDSHLCGLIYPLEFEASKQAEEYYNETFNK